MPKKRLPYLYEKHNFKIPPEKDLRRKLTAEQKDEIRRLFTLSNFTAAGLATLYKVSDGTIYRIVNPEAELKNREKSKYYAALTRSRLTPAKRIESNAKKRETVKRRIRAFYEYAKENNLPIKLKNLKSL